MSLSASERRCVCFFGSKCRKRMSRSFLSDTLTSEASRLASSDTLVSIAHVDSGNIVATSTCAHVGFISHVPPSSTHPICISSASSADSRQTSFNSAASYSSSCCRLSSTTSILQYFRDKCVPHTNERLRRRDCACESGLEHPRRGIACRWAQRRICRAVISTLNRHRPV